MSKLSMRKRRRENGSQNPGQQHSDVSPSTGTKKLNRETLESLEDGCNDSTNTKSSSNSGDHSLYENTCRSAKFASEGETRRIESVQTNESQTRASKLKRMKYSPRKRSNDDDKIPIPSFTPTDDSLALSFTRRRKRRRQEKKQEPSTIEPSSVIDILDSPPMIQVKEKANANNENTSKWDTTKEEMPLKSRIADRAGRSSYFDDLCDSTPESGGERQSRPAHEKFLSHDSDDDSMPSPAFGSKQNQKKNQSVDKKVSRCVVELDLDQENLHITGKHEPEILNTDMTNSETNSKHDIAQGNSQRHDFDSVHDCNATISTAGESKIIHDVAVSNVDPSNDCPTKPTVPLRVNSNKVLNIQAKSPKNVKKKLQKASSPGMDDFDVPRNKLLADYEKHLDEELTDSLRPFTRKLPSRSIQGGGKLPVVKKANKRTKKSKNCALCTTCPCSRGSSVVKNLQAGEDNNLKSLARSDVDIERALLGRLARLEKSASWFDELCYRVGRELKKHRTKVLKARGVFKGESRPTFLADVDENPTLDSRQNSLDVKHVNAAQKRLFGFQKDFQPTLTQMLNTKSENDGKDGDDEISDNESKSVCQRIGIEERDDTFVVIDEELYLNSDNPESNEVQCAMGVLEADTYYLDESSPDKSHNPLGDYEKAVQRKMERTRDGQMGNFGNSGIWEATTSKEIVEWSSWHKYETGIPGDEPTTKDEHHVSFHTTKETESNVELATSSESTNSKSHKSKWDDMVAGIIDKSDGAGLDELLHLFEINHEESVAPCKTDDIDQTTTSVPNQLTQRGQTTVDTLEAMIRNDTVKYHAIESVCPNWRENLRYAQYIRDEDSLRDAISNVRESRARLNDAKQQIMDSWQKQEHVLELFEMSLKESLNRFTLPSPNQGKNKLEFIVEEEASYFSYDDNASHDENASHEDTHPCTDHASSKIILDDDRSAELELESVVENIGNGSAKTLRTQMIDLSQDHQDESGKTNLKQGHDKSELLETHPISISTNKENCVNVSSSVPDLENMEIEDLKSLMSKYGFKACSRQKMIEILTRVFRELEKESNQSTTSKIASNFAQHVKNRTGAVTEPEKRGKAKSKQSSRPTVGADELKSRCANALRNHEPLRLLFLDHQTVELSQVQEVMETAGVAVSKKQLTHFLDEQGIQFADPWRQKQKLSQS